MKQCDVAIAQRRNSHTVVEPVPAAFLSRDDTGSHVTIGRLNQRLLDHRCRPARSEWLSRSEIADVASSFCKADGEIRELRTTTLIRRGCLRHQCARRPARVIEGQHEGGTVQRDPDELLHVINVRETLPSLAPVDCGSAVTQ